MTSMLYISCAAILLVYTRLQSTTTKTEHGFYQLFLVKIPDTNADVSEVSLVITKISEDILTLLNTPSQVTRSGQTSDIPLQLHVTTSTVVLDTRTKQTLDKLFSNASPKEIEKFLKDDKNRQEIFTTLENSNPNWLFACNSFEIEFPFSQKHAKKFSFTLISKTTILLEKTNFNLKLIKQSTYGKTQIKLTLSRAGIHTSISYLPIQIAEGGEEFRIVEVLIKAIKDKEKIENLIWQGKVIEAALKGVPEAWGVILFGIFSLGLTSYIVKIACAFLGL